MRPYIGLCLLLASNVVSQNTHATEGLPSEKDEATRSNVRSVENIRDYLIGRFSSNHPTFSWEIQKYRKAPDVTDDALRAALMEIYQLVQHLGSEPFQKGDPRELTENKRRLLDSIDWLGYCADEPVKRLLLDIANDETKAECYRLAAVSSSIQCADAQEVRDVILRFMVDVKIRPYSAWLNAFSVYDESEDDPQKREAILATLIVLLAKEERKGRFVAMDKKLAERDKEYATSAQRLAMLQRMSKLPPDKFPKTDPDLNTALNSFRFRFFKTNVSTNMTELMARDFSKPK